MSIVARTADYGGLRAAERGAVESACQQADHVVEGARGDFDTEGYALVLLVDGNNVEAQIVAEGGMQRAPPVCRRGAGHSDVNDDEGNDDMRAAGKT